MSCRLFSLFISMFLTYLNNELSRLPDKPRFFRIHYDITVFIILKMKTALLLLLSLLSFFSKISASQSNPIGDDVEGDTLAHSKKQGVLSIDKLKKRVVCLRKQGVRFPDIAILFDKSVNSITKLNRRWKVSISCSDSERQEYLNDAKLIWKELGHETMPFDKVVQEHALKETDKMDDIHESEIQKKLSFTRAPHAKYSPEFLERVVCLYKARIAIKDIMQVFSLTKATLYSLLKRHENRIDCSEARIWKSIDEAKKIKPDLQFSRRREPVLSDKKKGELVDGTLLQVTGKKRRRPSSESDLRKDSRMKAKSVEVDPVASSRERKIAQDTTKEEASSPNLSSEDTLQDLIADDIPQYPFPDDTRPIDSTLQDSNELREENFLFYPSTHPSPYEQFHNIHAFSFQETLSEADFEELSEFLSLNV